MTCRVSVRTGRLSLSTPTVISTACFVGQRHRTASRTQTNQMQGTYPVVFGLRIEKAEELCSDTPNVTQPVRLNLCCSGALLLCKHPHRQFQIGKGAMKGKSCVKS